MPLKNQWFLESMSRNECTFTKNLETNLSFNFKNFKLLRKYFSFNCFYLNGKSSKFFSITIIEKQVNK